MKTKVLQIFKFAYPYSYGGIEYVMHNISTGLVDAGWNVDTIATYRGHKVLNVRQNGVQLNLFPYNFIIASTPFSILMFLWGVRNLRKYDVVYLHYPYPFADLLALFLPKFTKLVVVYHSDIVRQSKLLKLLYRPLERRTFKRASLIIGTSPQYLSSSQNLQNLNKPKTFVPLSIDDPAAEDEAKPLIDLDFDKPYLLFVGAFRYYKGLPLLLQAMREVKCPLILLGDGDLLPELTRYKHDNKLHHVHFVGKLSNAEKNYCFRRAIGFIFPSNQRSEAFGVALLEASAFGLPMVTCEIKTGTSYVNLHGKTGLVVEVNDKNQLVDAINVLVHNEKKRNDFGKASRLRFLGNFSSSVVRKQHSKILAELVNGSPKNK